MDSLCQTVTFTQARELLNKFGFEGLEYDKEGFINESSIFSLAKKSGKDVKFLPIPNWDKFEIGNVDIAPLGLATICFQGLDCCSEKLLIITMESYNADKVFLVDFLNYEQFADSYPFYVGEYIDFVQPADYIFFLLNQKTAIFVSNEGFFTQLKLANASPD